MKRALGLAISGTEVRLAYLVNDKGQFRIEGLERARLKSTLEPQARAPEKKQDLGEPENLDAFGLKNTPGEAPNRDNGFRQQDTANLEILFGLLGKYTKEKTKIAFNVPLTLANYKRQEAPAGAASAERLNGLDLGQAQQLLKSQDGATVLTYDRLPPTLTLVREVNGYVQKNLVLALMETTELALANLARASLELAPDKYTAIIYIEDDFTRLIFLRGNDLFHVSSLISEQASSPDILEVIYRRLLYEQDEAQIPEISTILLAGKSCRLRAKEFFAANCAEVEVHYLSTDKLGSFPSNDTQRAVFSEFAVPIALAWKLLEPKNPAFVALDLLPQEVKDQQQVLKLSYHGYILLAITGFSAFFFTWQILKLRSDNGALRSKNSQLENQIESNQSIVDQVLLLENECKRLDKNLSLSDSLSSGHDEFLSFLKNLNRSVRQTSGLWVNEIIQHKSGFNIKGSALQREKIPLLAEKLEQASLRQVTRAESGGKQRLFQFELERQNLQGKFEFSERGIRIVDFDKAKGDGSLTFGKENPAQNMTPPGNNDRAKPEVTGAPAPKQMNHEDQAQSSGSNGHNAGTLNGIIKEASSARTVPPEPARSSEANTPVAPKRGAEVNSQTVPVRPKTDTAPVPIQTPPNPAESKPARSEISAAGTRPVAPSAAPESTQPQPPVERPAPKVEKPKVYRWYTIEAAATRDQALADQLVQAYRQKGYDAAVTSNKDKDTGEKLHRVLVGTFATQAAAQKKAEQMAGELLLKDYRVVGME